MWGRSVPPPGRVGSGGSGGFGANMSIGWKLFVGAGLAGEAEASEPDVTSDGEPVSGEPTATVEGSASVGEAPGVEAGAPAPIPPKAAAAPMAMTATPAAPAMRPW